MQLRRVCMQLLHLFPAFNVFLIQIKHCKIKNDERAIIFMLFTIRGLEILHTKLFPTSNVFPLTKTNRPDYFHVKTRIASVLGSKNIKWNTAEVDTEDMQKYRRNKCTHLCSYNYVVVNTSIVFYDYFNFYIIYHSPEILHTLCIRAYSELNSFTFHDVEVRT